MKKYTEYLEEKYIPLTRDDIMKCRQIQGDDGVKAIDMLLDEINYLRGLLSESYEWIGRKARSPMPKKYTNLMREAYRIHCEETGRRRA